jgi:four helix bundle protein
MKYDELEAYKLPFRLSVEVFHLTKKLPREEFFGGFVSQIRRCSTSIPANIAEGLSKYARSDLDECRFLSIALGSAEETRYWLSFGEEIGYLSSDDAQRLLKEYESAAKMIFGLIQHRRSKAA